MNIDDYYHRARAIVWEAAGYVSEARLDEVRRLIDHGEPAESLCSLAWAIVAEEAQVPRRMIEDIRLYSSDLVCEELMPGNLSQFAAD